MRSTPSDIANFDPDLYLEVLTLLDININRLSDDRKNLFEKNVEKIFCKLTTVTERNKENLPMDSFKNNRCLHKKYCSNYQGGVASIAANTIMESEFAGVHNGMVDQVWMIMENMGGGVKTTLFDNLNVKSNQ